jgi:hypothetical protein
LTTKSFPNATRLDKRVLALMNATRLDERVLAERRPAFPNATRLDKRLLAQRCGGGF